MLFTRIITGILIIVLFGSCGSSRPQVELGPSPKKQEIPLYESHQIKNKHIGFILYDPQSKKIINSHNRNKLFLPASTIKVITAALAIHILKPNYRFKTIVQKKGDLSDKKLHGDLIIFGGGNPFLSLRDMYTIVQSTKNKMELITGRILYNETFLPHGKIIEPIFGLDGRYNPGYSALSFEWNTIKLYWNITSKNGQKNEALFFPDIPTHRAILIPKKQRNIYFNTYQQSNKEIWEITYPIHKKKRYYQRRHYSGSRQLPVKNPGFFTASIFNKICQLHNLTIKSPIPQKTNIKYEDIDQDEVIYTHFSRPLFKILSDTIQFSNNLAAELIFLTTARKILGRSPKNFQEASKVLSKYIKEKLPKINWHGFFLQNGSGLSVTTRVSPEQLLAAILWGEKANTKEYQFQQLFPISGWESPLVRRFRYEESRYRIRAKTGTIFYGVSLAGYLLTKKGKWLHFAIIISDEQKRKKFDSLRTQSKLSGHAYNQGKFWVRQAKATIDDLIFYWLEKY